MILSQPSILSLVEPILEKTLAGNARWTMGEDGDLLLAIHEPRILIGLTRVDENTFDITVSLATGKTIGNLRMKEHDTPQFGMLRQLYQSAAQQCEESFVSKALESIRTKEVIGESPFASTSVIDTRLTEKQKAEALALLAGHWQFVEGDTQGITVRITSTGEYFPSEHLPSGTFLEENQTEPQYKLEVFEFYQSDQLVEIAKRVPTTDVIRQIEVLRLNFSQQGMVSSMTGYIKHNLRSVRYSRIPH